MSKSQVTVVDAPPEYNELWEAVMQLIDGKNIDLVLNVLTHSLAYVAVKTLNDPRETVEALQRNIRFHEAEQKAKGPSA